MSGPTIPGKYRDKIVYSTVVVGKCANVATNSVIIPGITIGESSVVGPNSVITKNTNPWAVYVGNPTRPVKIRNKNRILEFFIKLET